MCIMTIIQAILASFEREPIYLQIYCTARTRSAAAILNYVHVAINYNPALGKIREKEKTLRQSVQQSIPLLLHLSSHLRVNIL